MDEAISGKDLASAVTDAGYQTELRQLERWREARLLTPSTRGRAAVHTRSDISRCIAIHRSLAEKDDLKHAGRVLWASSAQIASKAATFIAATSVDGYLELNAVGPNASHFKERAGQP